MSKSKKEEVADVNDVMEDNYIEDEEYPFKWVDEFTVINVNEVTRAKISHDGSGDFVILFYLKNEKEPIEIYNKYIESNDDARFFIHLILQTYDVDVFNFNYFKEHPEEF